MKRYAPFALLTLLLTGPALAQDAPTAPTSATAVAGGAPDEVKPVAPGAETPKAETAKQPASITPPAPPADTGIVDPNDIGALIKATIESAKAGKWALFVGFIMMILTWLVNKMLRSKIPSKVMPWLAIGLSTITAAAFALAVDAGWLNAIVVGIQTGLAAAGTWSALGKYIPGLAKKPSAPVAPNGASQ